MDELEQLKKELEEARIELQKGRYAIQRIFFYVDKDYKYLQERSERALKMVGTRKTGNKYYYSLGLQEALNTFHELYDNSAAILKQQVEQ